MVTFINSVFRRFADSKSVHVLFNLSLNVTRLIEYVFSNFFSSMQLLPKIQLVHYETLNRIRICSKTLTSQQVVDQFHTPMLHILHLYRPENLPFCYLELLPTFRAWMKTNNKRINSSSFSSLIFYFFNNSIATTQSSGTFFTFFCSQKFVTISNINVSHKRCVVMIK